MTSIEKQAEIIYFTARNIAHNLDFIPEEKIDWKPAPEAKSALEIVNHVAKNMTGAIGLVTTGEWDSNYESATDRESAKTAILKTMNAYAAKLRTLTPGDLEKDANTPMGTFPLGGFVDMTVFDPAHHHGQIAYIQTLLGDGETHLDFS